MSVQTQTQSGSVPVPETPALLLLLARLFIPGVYIVLLLSGAIVLGIAGGIMYGVYLAIAGHNFPWRLAFVVAALGLGALVGVTAVIRGIISAIWQQPRFEPAMIINPGSEPELGRFLIGLCSRMDSAMPDTVVLHSEPTFYVTQAKLRTFNGEAKGRILALGLPLLGGLTISELRAILAHEFAHFTGGDTAYSSQVLPVYAGAITAWGHMTSASANYIEDSVFRQAAFNLPMIVPRLMLLAYIKVFHMLNMYISRTREHRADAIAVNTCGSRAFSKGLSKAVGIGSMFDDEACIAVAQKTREAQGLKNHYHAFRAVLPHMADLAKSHAQKVYNMPQGAHDTHPTLKSRLASIGDVPEQFDDSRPATVLIANLEKYEQQMHENMVALSTAIHGRRE